MQEKNTSEIQDSLLAHKHPFHGDELVKPPLSFTTMRVGLLHRNFDMINRLNDMLDLIDVDLHDSTLSIFDCEHPSNRVPKWQYHWYQGYDGECITAIMLDQHTSMITVSQYHLVETAINGQVIANPFFVELLKLNANDTPLLESFSFGDLPQIVFNPHCYRLGDNVAVEEDSFGDDANDPMQKVLAFEMGLIAMHAALFKNKPVLGIPKLTN